MNQEIAHQPGEPQHLRVVVLDDEDILRKFFKTLLQSMYQEIEIAEFADGDAACAELSRQTPDLLITDYVHPGMKCEEFLRLLKGDATLCHIPVLLITGHPRAVCAQFLQKFGLDIDRDVDGYVQKGAGFAVREFLDAVAAVLEKHGKPLPAEELRLRAQVWGA
jgi:CheY-like chemotaxis protein